MTPFDWLIDSGGVLSTKKNMSQDTQPRTLEVAVHATAGPHCQPGLEPWQH